MYHTRRVISNYSKEKPMPARAYWKGHLRLSLVTIGIELYTAEDHGETIRLNQIHRESGKRIKYKKTAAGEGEVKSSEIVKGYEVEDGEYVLLEKEELDALKLESKETIDLIQFVDHCEIDPRYFEKPYFVTPGSGKVAEEGFAVIRDALQDSGKVGLGQLAARGRDTLIAIRPCGRGLLLNTLRYGDELKDQDELFASIPETEGSDEMTQMALQLIEQKSAPWEPEKFDSQYEDALRDLIEEKRKTGKITRIDEGDGKNRADNVVDLMATLRKSVEQAKKKPNKAAGPKQRKTASE